ncbi:MAG TPA: CvpA family protein [Flavisolibacter sp.]
MLIDIIALVLLVMAAWKGIRKGLVVAVFSFVAFIIGLAAALKLSAVAAEYIGDAVNVSQRWLPVLAFFAVFFIVALLVRLGGKLVEGATQAVMLGWLNRLGGIIFYVLLYGFIFSIIIFYADQLHLVSDKAKAVSLIFPVLYAYAPEVMEILGSIIPVFGDMFQQLLEFFGKASAADHPA